MMVYGLYFGLLLAVAPAPTPDAVEAQVLRQFDRWFRDYRTGTVLYPAAELPRGYTWHEMPTRIDGLEGPDILPELLAALRQVNSLTSAQRVLNLAAFHFHHHPPTEQANYGSARPWKVRKLAAEALASFQNPAVFQWLSTQALPGKNQPSRAHRIAAVEALGKSRYEPALLVLLSILNRETGNLLAAAAEAVAQIGGTQAAVGIARRLDDPDPETRVRCLDALQQAIQGKIDPVDWRRIVAAVAHHLGDPDWHVRLAAADFFVAKPDKLAAPLLISAMRREHAELGSKSSRKRVLYKILGALQRCTGRNLNHPDPKYWEQWWRKNRDKFAADTEEGQTVALPPVPRFYKIPVMTDNMVFILDRSGSMDNAYQPRLKTGSSAKGGMAWEPKLDQAQRELIFTLENLQPTDRFNVWFFSGQMKAIFPSSRLATRTTVRRAIQLIKRIDATGSTNLFGVLRNAFGLKGSRPKSAFAIEADTFFILSDGLPTEGRLTAPEEILEFLDAVNRYAKVSINTICFGNQTRAASFMRDLARNHQGEFRNP